jgi:DNA polymerase zeta
MLITVSAPGQYDRKSDPASDSIAAIFYAFHDADIMLEDDEDSQSAITEGILVVQCHQFDPRRLRDISLEVASDELDLINRFVDLVCDMDPDVIAGWEIQMASWGYLTARSQYLGQHLLPPLIPRINIGVGRSRHD